MIFVVAGFVFVSILGSIAMLYAATHWRSKEPVKKIFSEALSSFVPYLTTSIWYFLYVIWPIFVGLGISLLGAILLKADATQQIAPMINIVGVLTVLFGFIFMVIQMFYYMFWPYVVLGEGVRDKLALKRSKELWSGNRKFIYGRISFGFAIMILVNILITIVLGFVGQDLAEGILGIVYRSIAIPISALYVVLMYDWLRSKNQNGFDRSLDRDVVVRHQ